MLLAAALAEVERRSLELHSLMVVRNGFAVLEAYFWPFQAGWVHDIASVTKSFTSTLIGIAIDKGYIKSADERLLDLLPGRTVANLDERKKRIRLKQLLTMSAGLQCQAEPTEVTLAQMQQSPDWVQFMLDLPMTDEPGARFNYSSGACHLLSAILTQVTGQSALEFARQHLFGPLGFGEAVWPTDSEGRNHGWGDLMITPRDMAKLGYLFAHGGLWEGKQVVSRQWVAAATRRHLAVSDEEVQLQGYGYLWWIASPGTFAAIGRGGQRIGVVPGSDLVVVTNAAIGSARTRELDQVILSRVVPAARTTGPLRANRKGRDALRSQVERMGAPPAEARPVPPLPKTASRVSGRVYRLERAPFGISGLRLRFHPGPEAWFTLAIGDDAPEVGVGLDGIYRVTPKGLRGVPAAARGSWEGENTFVLDFLMVSTPNSFRMSFTFEDDRVHVLVQEATGLGEHRFSGSAVTGPKGL